MPRKFRSWCSAKKKQRFILSAILAFIFVFIYLAFYCHTQEITFLSSMFDSISGINKHEKPLTKNEKILKNIASSLKVHYKVLSNFVNDGKMHQVVLTNRGEVSISQGNEIGWSMYFNDMHLLEFNYLSYASKYKLPNCDFELRHIDGSLFSLTPTLEFKGIEVEESIEIKFSSHITVSRDYILPRWYVAASGERPFIIKSTDDDQVRFVEAFETPQQWLRSSKDKSQPFSVQKRFEKYVTTDLKRAPLHVIPSPTSSELDEEKSILLNIGKWFVCTNPSYFSAEIQLISELFAIKKVKEGEPCPSSHVIKFEQSSLSGMKPSNEAYQIELDHERNIITITSPSRNGAFYAVQTLLSLSEVNDGQISYKLPSGIIKDSPRFEYRGLHIDVARNFIKLQDLLKIIKTMATYKLNKLHLHMTDDEGWRIEIEGLPELTSIGSVRRHCDKEVGALFPALGSGPFTNTAGTGFYSVADYREILKVASSHHIEVIPEIDVPGHCHAAIRSMEARYKRLMDEDKQEEAEEFLLSDLDDSSYAMSVQHYSNNAINPCMESTYKFVDHVIGALKKMHDPIQPLSTVHVGGDEVAARSWGGSRLCKKFLSESQGFPSLNFQLQEYFMRRVADICKNNHGLAMGVWEDGALRTKGDEPYSRSTMHDCDVTANAWNNNWMKDSCERAYKLANADYKVVMSQATHLYFDHPQEPDPEEKGLTWATRYIDDRMVFDFKPDDLYSNAITDKNGSPFSDSELFEISSNHAKLDSDKAGNIIGMQAQIWSEMLRDVTMVHFQLFPRLLAFAERAWHKAEWENSPNLSSSEDWTKFANTVGYKELARLNKRNIFYRIPPPGVKVVDGKFQLCSLYPGFKYHYRPITNGRVSDWSEVVSGDPIPDRNAVYEFKTSHGARHSRIVKMNQYD